MLSPLLTSTLTLAALVHHLPSAPNSALAQRRTTVPVLQYDQATYNPELSGLNPQDNLGSSGRAEGMHGTGSRFMPLSSVSKDSSPAVVCVAGVYPGITAEQLRAPQPVPFAPPGKWNYHMMQPDAAPGGFVAIPGSVLLDNSPDTVAVVCMSPDIGVEFPDGQEHECLALIDRSDEAVVNPQAFDHQAFYALADPSGAIQIRWMNVLPADWSVEGRVLFTLMPLIFCLRLPH